MTSIYILAYIYILYSIRSRLYFPIYTVLNAIGKPYLFEYTIAAPVINRELAKSQHEILPNASQPWSICCQANGLPKPNITWWKINADDSKLSLPTQSGCYILDSLIQDQMVKLQCIAQNVAGIDSILIDVALPKNTLGKGWHSSIFV